MFYSKFQPSHLDQTAVQALKLNTIPNELCHKTTIEGHFNDNFFKLSGGGKGQQYEGVWIAN